MQSIEKAIDRAINICGSEILEDKDIFWNAVEDLVPYHCEDFSFFLKLYDADLGSKLKTAYDTSNSDNQYLNDIYDYLLEAMGISEKKAQQFISYFSFLHASQNKKDECADAGVLDETVSYEIAKESVSASDYNNSIEVNYKKETDSEPSQTSNAASISVGPRNREEANEVFGKDMSELQMWAERGNVFCEYLLGSFYRCHEKDYNNAFKWLKKAADKGYDWAYVDLGQLYQEGQGTERNLKAALELYKRVEHKTGFAFVKPFIDYIETELAKEK